MTSVAFHPRNQSQQNQNTPNLKFDFNGKKYEITYVKQRIGTEVSDENDLDLTQLSANEVQNLVKEAIDVLTAVQKGMPTDWATIQSSGSFSFKFTQQPAGPNFLHQTLGRVFKNRFPKKEEPVVLETIVHDGITIDVTKKLKSAPKNFEEISRSAAPLHRHINNLASRKNPINTVQPQPPAPSSKTVTNNNNNSSASTGYTSLSKEEYDSEED